MFMLKTKQKEARQDMFTTTISFSPEVHQKLKHLAVDLRVSFRDLIRAAIESYLGRCKEEKQNGVETNSKQHAVLVENN